MATIRQLLDKTSSHIVAGKAETKLSNVVVWLISSDCKYNIITMQMNNPT